MVSVPITDDSVDDGCETLTLTLSNASGADLDDAVATGTIQNTEVPEPDPLTASFEDVPTEHDGSTVSTFRLRFSEDPAVSYKVLRDKAFSVSGGTVKKARRVDGRDDLREIHVKPETTGEIRIELPATSDCEAASAICTADRRPLSNSQSATVQRAGSEQSGFPLAPENSRPSGIWSDGEAAWVADIEDARLYAYQRSDGERQPAKDIATGPAPMGLWSDGDTLWMAGLGGGLKAHRLSDGARLAVRDLALEENAAPAGVSSDSKTLWVADWRSRMYAYRLSGGGTLLSTSWEDGEVRAFQLPSASPRAAVADQDGVRADILLTIADPALRASIQAELGKAPGDAVSPDELAGLEALNARHAGVRDPAILEGGVGAEGCAG